MNINEIVCVCYEGITLIHLLNGGSSTYVQTLIMQKHKYVTCENETNVPVLHYKFKIMLFNTTV